MAGNFARTFSLVGETGKACALAVSVDDGSEKRERICFHKVATLAPFKTIASTF